MLQKHSRPKTVRLDIVHTLASSVLIVVAFILSPHGKADVPYKIDYKGQFSLEYLGVESASDWRDRVTLRYIPDFTIQHSTTADKLWDLNISANIYQDYQSDPETYGSLEAETYRFNLQVKTSHSDTRIGLQKINFGPAVILRPLRWFDQVSPTDPLQITEAVKGIRYRYFFPDNTNIWAWLLYDNTEPKGYELSATKSNSPEFGARLQYPLASGEIGFSFHLRKTEGLGFSGPAIEDELNEKRIALDGKWDLGPGVWYEYVIIDQGADAKVDSNWFNMLTLGADYTFDIGNGIHVLAEHLINSRSDEALDWGNTSQTSAMQVRYPIGILDAISMLNVYAWEQERGFHYFRWDRTYDNWILGLACFTSSDQPVSDNEFETTRFVGDGLQAVIIFNH